MTFAPGPNEGLIRKLADTLLACSIGQRVSYQKLSAVVSGPIQERFHLIHRAIDLANKETGALFVNVKHQGYQRLPGDGLIDVNRRDLSRVRRVSRKAQKRSTNTLTLVNDISDKVRLKAYAQQSVLGLIQHATYDRNRPEVREGAKPPPTQEVVRASIEALRRHREP